MNSQADRQLVDEIRSARWQAFPPRTVVSVLPTSQQAAEARQHLAESGFSERDIMIGQGRAGAEALDPAEDDSWTQSLARMIQELGDARTYLERYASMVSEGRCFVAVRCETDERRDAAVVILEEAGALKLGYSEGATFVPKRD